MGKGRKILKHAVYGRQMEFDIRYRELSRLSLTVLQALLHPIVLHAFVTCSSPMSTRWKRTRPLALAKIKKIVVSCFRILHHHVIRL